MTGLVASTVSDQLRDLRARCGGIAPLTARLEPWQIEECADADALADALALHGSPLNILDVAPFARNVSDLRAVADAHAIAFRLFFARKANKAITFVNEALRLGLGVDVAGERELRQVLDRGAIPRDVVVTAAVKPHSLLRLCVDSGVTMVLDNLDELDVLDTVLETTGSRASVAIRLAPEFADDRTPTRFGMAPSDALAVAANVSLDVVGVHFHLDGYSASDRVDALGQAVSLVDLLREHGHAPSFVDIGGGIPMSYLESSRQWREFWKQHRAGLLGAAPPLTFDAHGLGLVEHAGTLLGRPAVYPYHQLPVRGAWLEQILASPLCLPGRAPSHSVASGLRERGLELRCEPGRSLLDGCGLTAARVEFRKQRRDGTWLIGLAMNRTQCRSTSDDFMLDPLLLRPSTSTVMARYPTGPIEGYLVGAYCIERELLTWQRLRFPEGVDVGDIVVFPNTAGYMMHILESASHQIPLARNVVRQATGGHLLDPIDS